MNGFRVLAAGAFLYCGPSFCFAQINILENQSEPRSILVKSGDENVLQPDASDLYRRNSSEAEIAASEIDSPFPDTDSSSSNQFIDSTIGPTPDSDPASLPVGIRHRHNPIDQILRNGLISQTPNSAQVPIEWPMQGPDNPTARIMMNNGCTQGLWASYPAERAAECALMYQRLAGNQRCHGCGRYGCGGCNSCAHAACITAGSLGAHFKPVNRYVPASCDSATCTRASHVSNAQARLPSQPQFRSLLAPAPTLAAPLTEGELNSVPENQDNVAQLPGLYR